MFKKQYLLRYHIIVYSYNIILHWSGGRDFWRLGGTRSRRAFPASVYWGNAVVPSSESLKFAFLFVRMEIYNPSIVITYHNMNCSPLDEICPSKGSHRSKDNIVKRFLMETLRRWTARSSWNYDKIQKYMKIAWEKMFFELKSQCELQFVLDLERRSEKRKYDGPTFDRRN